MEIENAIEKIKNTLSVKKILNDSSFDSYMYPTAYNDEMEIIRYFDFSFIDSIEFFAVDNWERKIEDLKADGVVYAIIPQNEEEIEKILSAFGRVGDNTFKNVVTGYILANEYKLPVSWLTEIYCCKCCKKYVNLSIPTQN